MQCIILHACGRNHHQNYNFKSQNNCIIQQQYLCNPSGLKQYSLERSHQTSWYSHKRWHTGPSSETDAVRNLCKVSHAQLYLRYHPASMSSNSAQLKSHSLSRFCPIRSIHSSASTHSDFPAEQNTQDDLTKSSLAFILLMLQRRLFRQKWIQMEEKRQAKDDFMHRNRCSERGQERDFTLLKMPTIQTTR